GVVAGVFVVIVLIAGMAALTTSARVGLDVVNQHSNAMMLRNYAVEHEGEFPQADEASNVFRTSTDAFRYLMKYDTNVSESSFWVPGNPEKSIWTDDGRLAADETCMIYATGQTDKANPDSPLIADEMETPGIYGPHHPWLRNGVAVVGYV